VSRDIHPGGGFQATPRVFFMQLYLSIIIPSYNTKKLLRDCLTSIYKQTKEIKFEIIVVDNGSKDGSVEMVKKKFPKVKLIALSKNMGYGRANNLGAKKAKGEWLLFLNSDTKIINQAIDVILKKTGDWGLGTGSYILGCKLLNPDGSIQSSAGYFPTLPKVITTMLFLEDLPILNSLIKPYQQSKKSFYQKRQEVDWVTGASLMIKKDLFKKIGGFDERFFMYAEEVDLCFRAKQKGAKVFYTPKAEIIHLKGASSKRGFETAVLGEYKGLKYFFKKHKPVWQLPILKAILFSGALLRIVVFGIIDKSKAKAYIKAIKKIRN